MNQVSIAFQLRSLDEVKPWGDPDAGLYLHWYGLTDGWYDLRVGDHHIFDTMVKQTVRLGEAPLVGRPVTSYASKSEAAEAYRGLAREVVALG